MFVANVDNTFWCCLQKILLFVTRLLISFFFFCGVSAHFYKCQLKKLSLNSTYETIIFLSFSVLKLLGHSLKRTEQL